MDFQTLDSMLHFDQSSLNSFPSPCALLFLQEHHTDQSTFLGLMLYLTLPAGSLIEAGRDVGRLQLCPGNCTG